MSHQAKTALVGPLCLVYMRGLFFPKSFLGIKVPLIFIHKDHEHKGKCHHFYILTEPKCGELGSAELFFLEKSDITFLAHMYKNHNVMYIICIHTGYVYIYFMHIKHTHKTCIIHISISKKTCIY